MQKGTIAEKMEGHLSDDIKEKRANIIKQVSKEKYEEFIKQNIGTIQEVLIEKRPDKHTGLYKGVTRNYLNILLNEGNFNALQKITITPNSVIH